MVTKKRLAFLVNQTVLVALGVLISAIVLIPFLWLISTSLKDRSDIFTYPPVWIPRHFSLSGYIDLWSKTPFADVGFSTFVQNSFLVASSSSLIAVILSALAGYSLSRFRFRGSSLFGYLILVAQMLPEALLLIPLYLLMRDLGQLDSLFGLVLVYSAFGLPYATWMLRGYFNAIPRDLDEAAMIDGCSQIGSLFRVVLPLAVPGVIVTLLYTFIIGWNEFLFALVFLNSFDKYTMPLALGSFRTQYLVEWNLLFAGAVVLTVPVLLMFLLMQKSLATGFTAGAVKG